MKLIKLNEDHYIVVDDSEIKQGDWIVGCTRTVVQCMYPENVHHRDVKKITHSTQPLYKNDFWAIQELKLSEVKELIGEVDVEKKALEISPVELDEDEFDVNETHRVTWIDGYNQALEDNKDKKYTEEDLSYLLNLLTYDDLAEDEKIESCTEYIKDLLQPKTEWEVEYDENGKLKLV